MTNETWLTDNTQVRTPDGWKNIYDLGLMDDVLSIHEGKVIRDKVYQISTCAINGTIRRYKDNDSEVFGKGITGHANFLKDKLVLPTEIMAYEGNMYHIRTRSNSLIVRSFYNNHVHNQNYTTLLCQKTAI